MSWLFPSRLWPPKDEELSIGESKAARKDSTQLTQAWKRRVISLSCHKNPGRNKNFCMISMKNWWDQAESIDSWFIIEV